MHSAPTVAKTDALDQPTKGDSRGSTVSEPSAEFFAAAWKLLKKDPSKAAALAYLWLTAVGVGRLFGTSVAFGLNAVDWASPGDFLVAGVRDPIAAALALVALLGIAWFWHRGITRAKWRWLTAVATGTLLLLAIMGSSAYRWAVVRGPWKDHGGPVPMTVTFEKGEAPIPGLRIIETTTEFALFYDEASSRTLAIKRDTIARMELKAKATVAEASPPCPQQPPPK
jgi:hypothetical protein